MMDSKAKGKSLHFNNTAVRKYITHATCNGLKYLIDTVLQLTCMKYISFPPSQWVFAINI